MGVKKKIKQGLLQENSRTTNTLFNFVSSVGGEFLTIVVSFIVRTVFIHTLGKQYLGINGLFSNILSMLSLAEFGVGAAIIFKLYEPIAKDDKHRITVLMKFYKTIYRYIGLVVLILGLILIPFLPTLVKDYDKLAGMNINAVVIFLLYLFRTVASYLFFAYKSAIVKAHQKEYILTLVSYFFTLLTAFLQIISLLICPNFMIYVGISVADVIVKNIVCARISDKMYPYINDPTADKVDKKEFFGLLKDCSALFIYRLNGVVLKATDNIVLSMFMGLEMVGMYSNYYIFYTTLNTLYSKIYNSVSHSLGNLHTTGNLKHEYKVYKAVNLITALLGGTAGVGLAVCSDEFVRLWIGESWVIPQPFSILLGVEAATLALRFAVGKYRSTMGLFQQAMYRPLFSMLINLVLSVLLVKYWGICGVLVGTIAADWLTTMWYDPLIIHKYGFRGAFRPSGYFLRLFAYVAIVAGVGALDLFICGHFLTGLGWLTVILHALICLVTVPAALIGIFYRTEEGRYVWRLILRYLKKIRKKRKHKKS